MGTVAHRVAHFVKPIVVYRNDFAFLISFDNVTVSLFMVSTDMRTLPLELFFHMQDSYDPMVASVSSIFIFISVIFIAILKRYMELVSYLEVPIEEKEILV